MNRRQNASASLRFDPDTVLRLLAMLSADALRSDAPTDPTPEREAVEDDADADTESPTDCCYTVADLCRILRVSRPSVYALLAKREFAWVKIGEQYRIPRQAFDEWFSGKDVKNGC